MNSPRVSPAQHIRRDTQKLLLIQVGVTVTAMVFVFFYRQTEAVEAVLFGGIMAMLNTWIAGRRTLKALLAAETGSGREVQILLLGALLRFVTTAVLFVSGMWLLELMPLPLLAGFALCQGAYFFSDSHKIRANLIKTDS
jgi:F0F1-type ATP synthase assembly protein I